MRIEAHYAQVSDTSHGCHHDRLDAIVDGVYRHIECARCGKCWDQVGSTEGDRRAAKIREEARRATPKKKLKKVRR